MNGPKSPLIIILWQAVWTVGSFGANMLVGALLQILVSHPITPVVLAYTATHQAIPNFQLNHNGNIINGDNQYSCMSVARYHVCPKHWNDAGYLTLLLKLFYVIVLLPTKIRINKIFTYGTSWCIWLENVLVNVHV